MKLPDGTILMHGKRPYDPAKARAYYLRTRQLKGRKKGIAAKNPDQVKYRAALDKFLKKLPMAIEGADLKTVEKFVDEMRTKTDDELREAAKNMTNTPGTQDASIKAATINVLLENRAKVRSKKADAKKVANRNTLVKQKKATKSG